MRYKPFSHDEQLALRILRYFGSNPRNLQPVPGTSETLLNLMAERGFFHCLKFLLEDISLDANFIAKSKRTALMIAAESGHIAIVQLLLSGRHCKKETIILSKDDITAAMLAAANGHESITQFFFPDRSKVGDFQRMLDIIALRRAAIEGEVDTVRNFFTLTDFPFDLVDFNGCTPFYMLSRRAMQQLSKYFSLLTSTGNILTITRAWS